MSGNSKNNLYQPRSTPKGKRQPKKRIKVLTAYTLITLAVSCRHPQHSLKLGKFGITYTFFGRNYSQARRMPLNSQCGGHSLGIVFNANPTIIYA